MKKITLLFFLFCLSNTNSFAQLTTIPDPNFEQALIDLGYDTAPINGWVFTGNISVVTTLSVFNKGIADLTGIEDFTALTSLNCNANALTSLDLSQNTLLETLFCTANALTSLDVSANTALEVLSCNNNSLTRLTTNNNLQILNCNGNNLTSLNFINYTYLTDLNCSNNQLTSLFINGCTNLSYLLANNNRISAINITTNPNLETVGLSDNQLTTLSLNNNTKLIDMDCSSNNLTGLDLSANTSLNSIFCQNNQLTSLDLRNGNNTEMANNEFNATNNPDLNCISVDDESYSNTTWFSIDSQTAFFFDCNVTTFVPDDNFEQALIDLGYDAGPLDDEVPTFNINGITSLDISAKNISNLTGIADFTALETLNCSINSIRSATLNLSTLTNLKTLICASNNLTALDVSKNLLLEELNCNSNSITSLDLNSNSNLKVLYCDSNDLSNLNLSKNTALEELRVTSNPSISALDVSNNTLLKDLRCANNGLSVLNLTNNTTLEKLFCNNNQITAIDVSNSNALTTLRCQNNNLSNLDVRNGNNTVIIDFNATSNPNLTCISVDDVAYSEANWTNIDAQTNFSPDCNAPQTYIPDDNFEQALINLGYDTAPLNDYVPTASINAVTSLNIQNLGITDLTGIEDFVALESLICGFNQLTSLNVSNLTSLKTLGCFYNQLTSLDLSNNLDLEALTCQNNQITNLDLSNNTGLINVNCNTNLLTDLDLRNGNNTAISNPFFNATNNPNLNCISVDNAAFSDANWTNIDAQTVFSDDCATLSTTDFEIANALQLYPNPATNNITIKTPMGKGITVIEIYNLLGKRMPLTSFENNTLNISHLPSGMYLLNIRIEEQTIIKKLIVD
ncbi:T9SS type A sorting domain-containing protein [Gelatiniphilus marinus]|uniref:T9SS type A sorting domain-containing protein n=1 Tax=Gelatiniphilus marinus TaxID=1759464 RepID=A0ABW5JTG4_9FLAO